MDPISQSLPSMVGGEEVIGVELDRGGDDQRVRQAQGLVLGPEDGRASRDGTVGAGDRDARDVERVVELREVAVSRAAGRTSTSA